MDAEGQAFRWPQDMERRRIAALRKFQRNNPNYKVMYEHLQGTRPNRIQGEICGPSSVHPVSSAVARKGRPRDLENRWCLATTMELLEEMKAYVRANKLRCIGEDMGKWKAIATHLTNPRGLELRRLARSSMVRFDNLRRYFRAGKVARMEVEVQDSLVDYFRVCERQQLTNLKKTSPRLLSTAELATNYLNYRRASLSPQPIPATEQFDYLQIATAMQGSQMVHDGEDSTMSSGDGWSGSSDEDAVGLSRTARGNLHPTSKNMETRIRKPLPQAAESEISDEETQAVAMVHYFSREGQHSLRRTRPPKPSTPSAFI